MEVSGGDSNQARFADDPLLEAALADPSKLGPYLRHHDSAGTLNVDVLRRVWKYASPAILHPITSHASVCASADLSNVQKKLFDPLEDYMFNGKSYEAIVEASSSSHIFLFCCWLCCSNS
jgi:hypothetical protein